MASDLESLDDEPRRPRRWIAPLIFGVVAFGGGAAAMGYALTHWTIASTYIAGRAPEEATPVLAPAPIVADPRSLPSIEGRVGELEARLGSIGARANAAVGNADRAEGLLVAFAARRALDRGVQLGYIEALLRERFGGTQPQAVATILSAGRQPVTLDELQGELSDLAPELASAGPDEGWWDGVKRELAAMVVVRKADTPSPDPEARMARARQQIGAGHVAAALAEVARMPGRAAATAWIARARRYVAARSALDAIETAALLEPRNAMPPATDPVSTDPAQPAQEPAAKPTTKP